MKPIIVYINEEKTNDTIITLTKKELERIINEAYYSGRADGFTWQPLASSQPIITYNDHKTSDKPYINIPTITCDTLDGVIK